jgi:hypothetical protein
MPRKPKAMIAPVALGMFSQARLEIDLLPISPTGGLARPCFLVSRPAREKNSAGLPRRHNTNILALPRPRACPLTYSQPWKPLVAIDSLNPLEAEMWLNDANAPPALRRCVGGCATPLGATPTQAVALLYPAPQGCNPAVVYAGNINLWQSFLAVLAQPEIVAEAHFMPPLRDLATFQRERGDAALAEYTRQQIAGVVAAKSAR